MGRKEFLKAMSTVDDLSKTMFDESLVNFLNQVHMHLLENTTQLDGVAREVLYDNLWDLYDTCAPPKPVEDDTPSESPDETFGIGIQADGTDCDVRQTGFRYQIVLNNEKWDEEDALTYATDIMDWLEDRTSVPGGSPAAYMYRYRLPTKWTQWYLSLVDPTPEILDVRSEVIPLYEFGVLDESSKNWTTPPVSISCGALNRSSSKRTECVLPRGHGGPHAGPTTITNSDGPGGYGEISDNTITITREEMKDMLLYGRLSYTFGETE